jgi:VanZ family protein
MYTPGRMADFWDWLTDILGVLIFVMWFKKRNPLKVE